MKSLSHVQLFATPWTTTLLCPWGFPVNSIGVGCHFPLEMVFPTQGSNLCPPTSWDECNFMVVWAISFLWDWNESWLFLSCGHSWVFQICWHIVWSTFTALSFRIWNRSTGIPSPSLPLFVVMLPKTHLTSHSRMSGPRWVITPSWLSGSCRPFLYSSVYSCHCVHQNFLLKITY